jgi:plastocyanin
MTGVVHVLASNQPLPHTQQFYDRQASLNGFESLADLTEDKNLHLKFNGLDDPNGVAAGTGEVTATAGGSNTLSLVRFIHDPTVIHAGQTVEWDNQDPVLPHTITFGAEPTGDPFPPSANVTVDKDGARHAVIVSPSDNVHSGFIVASPQDRTGLPQSPLGVTRFRITFPQAGTFPYICALHDELGMKGTVIVKP